MSVEVERATVPCIVCGAQVLELRRGRCWGCYSQWADLRPVGKGAACAVCQERRRDHLRLVELHNRSIPLCHGCGARTMRLEEIPRSLEVLRLTLRRDRRADERRSDEREDGRIFPRERRVGDRRATQAVGTDTDPHIALPDFDDLVIEITDGDFEEVEQTLVRARPTSRNG
jgi:hypothetical protein